MCLALKININSRNGIDFFIVYKKSFKELIKVENVTKQEVRMEYHKKKIILKNM
jgi:hypothetical protein